MTLKIQHTNGEGLPDYPSDTIPLPDITVYVHDSCMIVNHNFPCPVCKINHAVYVTNTGIFQPCWDCEKKGYKIIKITKSKSWFSKLFK